VGTWAWLGPRLYDPFLALGERRGLQQRRRQLLAGASGRVLEIGAGTGLNVRHYPAGLDELVLAEPDLQMARGLQAHVAAQPRKSTVIKAPAEELPFDSHSFDTVVSTMVLCTVPVPLLALNEVRRVLRPDGQLLFIEHVRSDDPSSARWQDRLHPVWKPFALGCHCNRDTLGNLQEAGWAIASLQRFEWRGMPSIVRPVVAGTARPTDPINVSPVDRR
jgi:ubiquinone/menaquinone biosynthesis C-methylase UbiE